MSAPSRLVVMFLLMSFLMSGCDDDEPSPLSARIRLKTVSNGKVSSKIYDDISWLHYTCFPDVIVITLKARSRVEFVKVPLHEFSSFQAKGKFDIWLPICTYQTSNWSEFGISMPLPGDPTPNLISIPHPMDIERLFGLDDLRKDFGEEWTDILTVENDM